MPSDFEEDRWIARPGQAAPDAEGDQVTVLRVEETYDIAPLTPEDEVAAALGGALFGPLALSDAEKAALPGADGRTHGTYAILDAARIPNLIELLDLSGLEHRCLFAPDKVEELGAVAPWLVALTSDTELTRALLTEGDPARTFWQSDGALFLRHAGSFDALWRHLGGMTRLQDEAGAWHYLRYWDPRVAFHYFNDVRAWPERVETFFASSRIGALQMLAVDRGAGVLRRFSLGAPVAGSAGPDDRRVTERDRQIFQLLQVPKLKQELADWLLRYDAPRFRPFGEDRLRALVDHGVAQGTALRFIYKEEYAYLLYMMSFLGGWFHTSPLYAHISARFETPAVDRHLTVSTAFPDDYRALFRGTVSADTALVDLNHYLKRRLEELGGWAAVRGEDAGDVVALFARASTLPPEVIETALADADRESDRLLIRSAPARGIVRVLWLFLGARFTEDPLFPWIREKLFRDDRIEANLMEVAIYGARRLDRIEAMLRRRHA
ncbi:MAG: DUF4123 domain-containing protein [Pseudomonadota bacterium]